MYGQLPYRATWPRHPNPAHPRPTDWRSGSGPNSARFSERDAETAEKNSFVLDRIAQILTKYRTYRITIEGHANPVFYNDPVRAETEEREELKPLSQARAETVRKALVDRGIHPGRLSVIGRGGSDIIADPGNREVNWKNRRVEFILEK